MECSHYISLYAETTFGFYDFIEYIGLKDYSSIKTKLESRWLRRAAGRLTGIHEDEEGFKGRHADELQVSIFPYR